MPLFKRIISIVLMLGAGLYALAYIAGVGTLAFYGMHVDFTKVWWQPIAVGVAFWIAQRLRKQ